VFIPDPNFLHTGSASKILRILTQNMVSKLSEIWSGLFILDPDPDFLPVPDPGVKKTPDPGSATLKFYKKSQNKVKFLHKFSVFAWRCLPFRKELLKTTTTNVPEMFFAQALPMASSLGTETASLSMEMSKVDELLVASANERRGWKPSSSAEGRKLSPVSEICSFGGKKLVLSCGKNSTFAGPRKAGH
jgi:hypothetical protein